MITYPTNMEVFDFSHWPHPDIKEVKLLNLILTNEADAKMLDRLFKIEMYSFLIECGKGNKVKLTIKLMDREWSFTYQGRRKYSGFDVDNVNAYFLFIGHFDKKQRKIIMQEDGHIIFFQPRIHTPLNHFYLSAN